MANKPFEIQSSELVIGGVKLQAGTTGVVIPGVTHASSYKVEEVNDRGDQTATFTNGVDVAIDQVIYAAKVADAGANVSAYAVYIVYLDDQNYIDTIEVDSRGSYTGSESTTNESNDMWEYNGTDSDPIANFVSSDWVQVPFRPRMRAGAVVSEAGATALSGLSDVGLDGPSNGQVLTWNSTQEQWQNQSPTGSGSIGSFGTDKGVGPDYASNNPAVLFSDDDMVIRTGGTASTGGQNYGAMYIAAAEDLYIGTTHMANLVDSTGPSPSDYATYINFNYNGTTIDITAGSNTLSIDSSTGLLYNGSAISGSGSGDHIANGANTLTIDSNGNIVLDNNPEGAHDRGLIWNWGARNGGVNASITHGDAGITIQSFSDNGPYSNGSPINLVTNPGPGQYTWSFGTDGSITFPDNSVQTTAYTLGGAGGGTNVNNWFLDIATANTSTGYVETITAVEYDSQGNTLAVGARSPEPINGHQAMTLMKFDTHGNLIWQNLFADSVQVSGWGLAVDNNNDVIVSGIWDNNYDNSKLFLLKVSGATGDGIWGTAVADASTSTTASYGMTVDVDSNNDIIAVGYVVDTANNNYNDDFVVAKFANSNGANIWARKLGDAFFDQDGYGLGVGSLHQNEIIVTGYNEHYTGGVVTGISHADPTSNPAWVGTDIIIVTPNAGNHGLEIRASFTDGVPSFTVVAGGAGWNTGNYITIDGAMIGGTSGADNMNIYVTVDQAPIYNNQALVAKYDTDGTLQWQRLISVPGDYCSASDADVDSNGNVYLVGNYGQENINTQGIVVQFDASGTLQWSRQIGLGYCFAGTTSIVVGSDNLLYISGMASSGSINNITDSNIFVGAYNESGVVQWQRTFGRPDRVEVSGAIFSQGGASTIDVHGDYIVLSGGHYNNFLATGDNVTDAHGFLVQLDKAGTEQVWGGWSLVPSYLPEAASTLTVTVSTLPDVAWSVTQSTAEPSYGPDSILVTRTLGSLEGGVKELVNGTKHLTLNADGSVTPPTISGTPELKVKGNISIPRDAMGWAVEQASQSNDVWGTATTTDPAGNVYMAGGWYDWDWDGDDRPMVIKYNSQGVEQWRKTFRYDGSLFGGESYSIEYNTITNHITLVFTNWYNNSRPQIVTMDPTNGAVIDSTELANFEDHTFYPRGLTLSSTGTWAICGEAQNDIALTAGVKDGATGSTTGILVLPKSYFTDPNHQPVAQGDWNIKTTYDDGTFNTEYLVYINRYYNNPTFDLIGSGANATITLEYSITTGEINSWWVSDYGLGYAVGDAFYVQGTDIGCTATTLVVGDVNSAISTPAGYTTIVTNSVNARWTTLAAAVQTTSTYRAVIFNEGSNFEAPITAATYDGTNCTITLDSDYSGTLTTATSNIIVYNIEGTTPVYFITSIGGSGEAYSVNQFGHVNTDIVKLDTQGSVDYGTQFQQVLLNNPGDATANFIKVAKADYLRWADIQLGWTWNDGTNSGVITGLVDNSDGYIIYNLDNGEGNVLGNFAPVTVTSVKGLFQPYYTVNSDGSVYTNNGVAFNWGTANNNQRFNVIRYGQEGSIYVSGRDTNQDKTIVAKFNSQGTADIWHSLLQGSRSGYDRDCHGMVVADESGTEYVYAIAYDGDDNGILYKLLGSTGAIVWGSYVFGGDSGNNDYYWNSAPALELDSLGNIIVAGIAYTPDGLYNNRKLVIITVAPDGSFVRAKQVENQYSIRSQYEGDENDYQFVIETVDGVDSFVGAFYHYDTNDNLDISTTFKIPLIANGDFSINELHILDISSTAGAAVGGTEDFYDRATYTDAVLHSSSLSVDAGDSNYISSEDPYLYGSSESGITLIELLSPVGGEIQNVKNISFEDGSSQSTAYDPLMKSVVNTNYWYYLQAADAGKFLYCDGNTYGIEIPDDAARNLPVGFALTIIAPIGRDITLYPWYNNYPPTIIVPGNDPQKNSNDYSGWTLKGGGMVTILKVASNTYYLSGGKLEAL